MPLPRRSFLRGGAALGVVSPAFVAHAFATNLRKSSVNNARSKTPAIAGAFDELLPKLAGKSKTRSQKLAEAGFKRRPSAKSLASDE